VVNAFPNPADIRGSARILEGFLKRMAKDVKVLYDKPSRLRDGTPAQEMEIEWARTDGPTTNTFLLATKKEGMWIWISLQDDKGKMGEDLKAVAYSLKVPEGGDEAAALPPDVRTFIDNFWEDMGSGDTSRIMANFSDRYLNNGMKKAAFEQWLRYAPISPIQAGLTSFGITVTRFELQGDKAYLAGFGTAELLNGAPAPAAPISGSQIIKESGQWKWYGNQK
jgi:hypothetical protein